MAEKDEVSKTGKGAGSDEAAVEGLAEQLQKDLGLADKEDDKLKQLLPELTLEGVGQYINDNKCKKILTMTGAGISTSAGIPDFRSPGSGLYHNLEKYNLPDPMAIFSIEYFDEKPQPFFTLAKELYPGSFKPTPCHYFIRMLHEKGLLLRAFTQNIDTLEHVAGIPEDKVVEAHGSFKNGHCRNQDCKKKYSLEWMRERIFDDKVPACEAEDCVGVVKPDIIFFGEPLPMRFFMCAQQDLKECDLLIVMGTSLKVEPFASLVSKVPDSCPRVYINMEKPPEVPSWFSFLGRGGRFEFDSETNYRDVFWGGYCDDGCLALADVVGWKKELEDLIASEHKTIDEASAQKDKGAGKGEAAKDKSAEGADSGKSKV